MSEFSANVHFWVNYLFPKYSFSSAIHMIEGMIHLVQIVQVKFRGLEQTSFLAWAIERIKLALAPLISATLYKNMFCLPCKNFDFNNSLQRIYWWASDVMLNFFKSGPMKKYFGWSEREYTFSKFSFLGELFL